MVRRACESVFACMRKTHTVRRLGKTCIQKRGAMTHLGECQHCSGLRSLACPDTIADTPANAVLLPDVVDVEVIDAGFKISQSRMLPGAHCLLD